MIHDSCINYATMLTLYRDNSLHHRKEKYKCDMQRPGFLGEEKILIFSDENNIAKLVGDM